MTLNGPLDAGRVAPVWEDALRSAGQGTTVEAQGVTACDGAGLALLFELGRRGAEVRGLSGDLARQFEAFRDKPPDETRGARREPTLATLGRAGVDLARDLVEQTAFVGQMAAAGAGMIFRPREMRWTDMWMVCERAGVQALIVVGMISFLTGLIMAFQAAPPLEQFGVEIFVINLVALAMVRELGPIMTAIVLAGRSGSAFAAEIGTMKVNEEINALTTMGLDPVRFLAAPRVLAGILITPVLTIYANLLGVAGGFSVMLLHGFPAIALWRQLTGAVGINDVLAGVIKAFVFGALVAGIGCLRGLQTKSGASAVGVSTTRSVVSGIVLVVIVDAIFAVVYYAIGF